MPLIDRWYQILQFFMVHPQLTIDDLKKATGTSSQTIKNSIQMLNEQIADVAEIIQTGNQFELNIIDFDGFDSILTGSLKEETDFNSPSKRTAYIIDQLIFSEKHLLIDDLSESLGVSRGTVNNDLKSLKKLLLNFELRLEGTPNRGVKLVGDELNIRLLYSSQAYDYFSHVPLKNGVVELAKKLTLYWQMESKHFYFWQKVIDITIQRVKNKQSLTEPISHYINTVERNQLVEEFIAQIEIDYGILLGQSDLAFLFFPINLHHFGKNVSQLNELEDIFQEMMHKIQQVMIVDLDLKQMYENVKQHLLFLINRLVFHIQPTDIFQDEIEKNYPFAYQLASIGIGVLEKQINRTAGKAEISYLAIYFELILRNVSQNDQKEVAIVCTTGRGTAALIRRQIENVLGPEVKIQQFLENEYEKVDLNKFFAVFTTIPLKQINPNVPVIRISNLFNDDWIRSEWERVNHEQLSKFEHVLFYFNQVSQKQNYQEILVQLLNQFEAEAVVDLGFAERIFEREAKHTTIFSQGVAFPHAILKNSQKILYSVTILQEPLITDEGEVSVIFLVGIPEETTEENESELLVLYDLIFAIAARPNYKNELLGLSNGLEFKAYLKREGLIS
ncbi:BglG family transcription antiterminator [Enterococcus alishanensis]|uniref:Helix-turn-helix domain-containing protein n=1 Tax=Enterococcus alishanensis TaxID=1303817 RepID=A0ABS6TCN6_9ENTE|nr:helix-turn-helix domain-containing protein [Enterococcus alishanensis]MBV7390658.1 helix-turn-helix domain-containing protein [Enterococcus alishanensis]